MRRSDRELNANKSRKARRADDVARLRGKYMALQRRIEQLKEEAAPKHPRDILRAISVLAAQAERAVLSPDDFGPGLQLIAGVAGDLQLLCPPSTDRQRGSAATTAALNQQAAKEKQAKRANVVRLRHAALLSQLTPIDAFFDVYLALDDCSPFVGWSRAEIAEAEAGRLEMPDAPSLKACVASVRTAAGRSLPKSVKDLAIKEALDVFMRPVVGAGRPRASRVPRPKVRTATEQDRAGAIVRLFGQKTTPQDMARMLRNSKKARERRANWET